MDVSRAFLSAAVGIVLVACEAGSRPPASSSASGAASSEASAPSTIAPTTMATASPTKPAAQTPLPTASPAPPMPTRVRIADEIEPGCDPAAAEDICVVGESILTIAWEQPRTPGVEVQAFGVKTCYGTDESGDVLDGWCLRPNTPLHQDDLVSLARAPASRGRVDIRVTQDERRYATLRGTPLYGFVVASYDADGRHSVFAIADRAEYCRAAGIACPGWDGDEWGVGSWMTSVVDGLRVRSVPSVATTSVRYTPLLRMGTEFLIIRGPVLADGYRWYRIRLTAGILDDGVTVGWIAAGSRDGEAWIEPRGIDEG